MITTSKVFENRYKTGRINSGFTQEHAAELLHVSTRTLSDYENGVKQVPDEIVKVMVEIYQVPYLGYWHLRETNPLGPDCLPEIIESRTLGDMAMLAVMADDELGPAIGNMKDSMPNLKLSDNKFPQFTKSLDTFEAVSGKLISILMYGRKIGRDSITNINRS